MANMILKRLVAACFVSVILLVGCNRQVQSERISRWLKGVPCKSPCWEGITPGKTPATQAIDLLKINSFIDHSSFPVASSDTEIDWKWSDSHFGLGEIRFTSAISEPSSIVNWILVDLPEPVYLYQVIQAYGEPSHIVAYKFNGKHGDGPFYILFISHRALPWKQVLCIAKSLH